MEIAVVCILLPQPAKGREGSDPSEQKQSEALQWQGFVALSVVLRPS